MKQLFKDRYVLALDPSGSYKEGQGTTGWVLLDQETGKILKFGTIKAIDYSCQFKYWDAHVQLIDQFAGYHPTVVVEDYMLYGTEARAQINSRLETPQLLGILKYETYKRGMLIYIQTAAQVKVRWTDEILAYKGYLRKEGIHYNINGVPVVSHTKDAIRHAIHFMTYNSNYRKGDSERYETRRY